MIYQRNYNMSRLLIDVIQTNFNLNNKNVPYDSNNSQ